MTVPHVQQKGLEKFITQIRRLSAKSRMGSQAGVKMAWKSRERTLFGGIPGGQGVGLG